MLGKSSVTVDNYMNDGSWHIWHIEHGFWKVFVRRARRYAERLSEIGHDVPQVPYFEALYIAINAPHLPFIRLFNILRYFALNAPQVPLIGWPY